MLAGPLTLSNKFEYSHSGTHLAEMDEAMSSLQNAMQAHIKRMDNLT
jgi:hypothetical protein